MTQIVSDFTSNSPRNFFICFAKRLNNWKKNLLRKILVFILLKKKKFQAAGDVTGSTYGGWRFCGDALMHRTIFYWQEIKCNLLQWTRSSFHSETELVDAIFFLFHSVALLAFLFVSRNGKVKTALTAFAMTLADDGEEAINMDCMQSPHFSIHTCLGSRECA